MDPKRETPAQARQCGGPHCRHSLLHERVTNPRTFPIPLPNVAATHSFSVKQGSTGPCKRQAGLRLQTPVAQPTCFPSNVFYSVNMNIENNNQRCKPSIAQIIRSVIAAAVGIQTETNRQKDFQEGASPKAYILVGLIATVVFILTVIMIVRLVVTNAAGS